MMNLCEQLCSPHSSLKAAFYGGENLVQLMKIQSLGTHTLVADFPDFHVYDVCGCRRLVK